MRSPDIKIKRYSMIVISHLALNEMLKLKGEIVDICLLLDSTDIKLRDLVKQFLYELRNKGNNIVYNMIPKALHTLNTEYKNLPYETFKTVIGELIQNIEKDKQVEGLIEKLVNKLKNNNDKIEWRNVTYCLNQLTYSEKNLTKLLDHYTSVKAQLVLDSEIIQNFKGIFEKSKKIDKEIVAELENRFFEGDNKKLAEAIKEKKNKKKKIGVKRTVDDLLEDSPAKKSVDDGSNSESEMSAQKNNLSKSKAGKNSKSQLANKVNSAFKHRFPVKKNRVISDEEDYEDDYN